MSTAPRVKRVLFGANLWGMALVGDAVVATSVLLLVENLVEI